LEGSNNFAFEFSRHEVPLPLLSQRSRRAGYFTTELG
jgi:hypothetical protein